ncbi:hypothetical protein D3C87_2161230 [compost metagenome]
MQYQLPDLVGEPLPAGRIAQVGKMQFAAEARLVEAHRLFAIAVECKEGVNRHWVYYSL